MRTSPFRWLFLFLIGSSGAGANIEPACIRDVRATLEGVWSSSDESVAFPLDLAAGAYTQNWKNYFGLNNHFQGIQSAGGNRFIISAGDYWRRKGTLLFIEPPKGYRPAVTSAYSVGDRTFWHTSGIGSAGNILAVPIETYLVEKTHSRIEFFDVGNFKNPRSLTRIDRLHDAATATAVRREKDGRYLLAVLSEARLDFYHSKSSHLETGFPASPDATVTGNDLPIPSRVQNLGLIGQCDGSLYLVGFGNTSPLPPLVRGDDIATLYSVDFEKGGVKVALVSLKKFECGEQCNFAGAAGLDLDAHGYLRFFAPLMYRDPHGTVRMRTFRPVPSEKPAN